MKECYILTTCIEARFAFAGIIEKIYKKKFDPVKPGEILASISRKQLQTELDRQLADYEKIRAQFDSFKQKTKNENEENIKFQNIINQSTLTSSVKDVEVAKYKLDSCDLICPIHGTIVDLGGMVEGLYVTPSGNPVRIVDNNSFFVSIPINQSELGRFMSPQTIRIHIQNTGIEFDTQTFVPVVGKDGIFEVTGAVSYRRDIIPGMKCDVDV